MVHLGQLYIQKSAVKRKKTQKAQKLKTEKKAKRGEGVCVYKQKNSWIAKVWSGGVRVYLGSHPHEFAAKEAVKEYRQSLYKRLEDQKEKKQKKQTKL